jgi:hypothetical protein
MPLAPVASCPSIHLAMASSQGARSASSSGTPRLIFSMLAGGWKLSASRNGQPKAFDRALPTVLLPQPETPINTTTRGSVAAMTPGFPSLDRRQQPARMPTSCCPV